MCEDIKILYRSKKVCKKYQPIKDGQLPKTKKKNKDVVVLGAKFHNKHEKEKAREE